MPEWTAPVVRLIAFVSLPGHRNFSGDASVLADLFCVLKADKLPQQRRHLRRQQSADGHDDWEFAEHPGQILWTWHFEDRLEQ